MRRRSPELEPSLGRASSGVSIRLLRTKEPMTNPGAGNLMSDYKTRSRAECCVRWEGGGQSFPPRRCAFVGTAPRLHTKHVKEINNVWPRQLVKPAPPECNSGCGEGLLSADWSKNKSDLKTILDVSFNN